MGDRGEGHGGSEAKIEMGRWGCGRQTPGLELSGTAPVPVGELALVGGHQQDVVNLILDAEGVLRDGLILGARVRAHEGVLQPHLGC